MVLNGLQGRLPPRYLCYHPDNMANWISAFFTVVIAIATTFYVVFTKRLWKETKRSADAATTSAEAAKKSADAAVEAALAAKKSAEVTAELHRPFMGLSGVTLKNGWNTRLWDIAFGLKNYGTLPALNVSAMMEFFTDSTRRAQKTEPASVQIFPGSEHESIVRFDMGEPDKNDIHQERKALDIGVRITYQTPDGRNFEYSAQVSYKQGRFAITNSETH